MESKAGFRVLSEADVRACLSVELAVNVNEAAFLSLGKQEADVPQRIQLKVPEHKGVTLFKPAKVGPQLGMKLVSTRPDNAKHGLPTVPAVIMLLDVATGLPQAMMGAAWLTARRTAAGSAVTTRLWARKDAEILTVFGAGAEATEHIHCMLGVRPSLHTVYIVNRTLQRANDLAAASAKIYPKVKFTVISSDAVKDVEHAVKAAHIICTTTNSFTPLFDGRWVSKGCHINCIGSYQPQMQEVDEATICGATCVVVDTAVALGEAGDLIIPLKKGLINAKDIIELGTCLAQQRTVRATAEDITLFKSVGTAAQDVATAYAVWQEAEKKQLGTTVQL